MESTINPDLCAPRRGRARVRGGSTAPSSLPAPAPEAAVVGPQGGSTRPRGRGSGRGAARGRGVGGRGSARPGPRIIDQLTIREEWDLPANQGLEPRLRPSRKRQWRSSDPAPQTPPPPHMEAEVKVEDSPPSPPPPVREPSQSPTGPPPPVPSHSVSSPLLYVECVLASSSMECPRPRQSLGDAEIVHQLCYGSEPDSGDSEDEDLAPLYGITRAQMSTLETPMDSDEDDDDADPTPAPVAVPADDTDVRPTATDQLRSFYDFDWNDFPNVPIPPESRRESFSHINVGPTAPCVDPYDIFISIWDRQFMEYIAAETNRYARQVAAQLLETDNLHPHSRISLWQETTADELYMYFGIVLAMGVVVKSPIEEYWGATPSVFYTPGFSAHMSYNRFQILEKCIHFVNNEDMCALELDGSEAKLFKVQPLLSHLNNKFQSLYRLGQNIALDESLLRWKVWLNISQLIPDKADSIGIKTYEICEPQTGYLWRFEVHGLGKSQRSPPEQLEDPMKASTPATVLRLINGLEGKGHTLWMDYFYNSPCLARRLKTLGFDCAGTLRTNRKLVPQALHSLTEENMRKGQITGLTSGDVDVMVWRDNNRVAMISTYHGNAVSQIRGSTKPILIHDFNTMMGGVDKKDRMLAMFPIERKRSQVWYKKLFRRLLNISTLNSYIIHRQSFPSSPLSHRNFRISLIKSLLSKHPSPNFQPATTQNSSQSLSYLTHHLAELPFANTKVKHQRLRRKCLHCGKKTSTFCVGCSKSICIGPCFLALHL